MKILILGHAQSGKDRVAELFSYHLQLRYENASIIASREFIFDKLRNLYNYKTPLDCYNDRDNVRPVWYYLFHEYNLSDKGRFVRKVLENYDIYAGLRDSKQVEAVSHLFDLIVWVDADKRNGTENFSSCNVTSDMADVIIDNNAELDCLYAEVLKIINKYKYGAL